MTAPHGTISEAEGEDEVVGLCAARNDDPHLCSGASH